MRRYILPQVLLRFYVEILLRTTTEDNTMFQQRARLEPHPVSHYESPFGTEVFITLRTRPCKHARKNGPCKFCGLHKQDAQWADAGPLTEEELLVQMRKSLADLPAGKRGTVRKVSIITNCHSTITPDVIPVTTLNKGLSFLVKKLPKLRHISLETRGDMVDSRTLEEISNNRDLVNRRITKELTIGVESGIEAERLNTGKRLSDQQIASAAKILAERGWGLRAYIIHHLPGRPLESATADFVKAAEFMAGLRWKFPKIPLTICTMRGYIPAERKEKDAFSGYTPASERQVIESLLAAAEICRRNRVTLSVDLTDADQLLTNAVHVPVTKFQRTVEKFHKTQDPTVLRNALRRKRQNL